MVPVVAIGTNIIFTTGKTVNAPIIWCMLESIQEMCNDILTDLLEFSGGCRGPGAQGTRPAPFPPEIYQKCTWHNK
jgi:hypothetical protein